MPDSVKLTKAELQELGEDGEPTSNRDNWTTVQFNPDTLKVSFSNQVKPPETSSNAKEPSDTRGNAAIQFVGKGTTKLSVQLWFDVTAQMEKPEKDVQHLIKKIAYFLTPNKAKSDPKTFIPSGVRFVWGTFQFDGIMESMEESLEFFSADGVPLRASVTISLTKQEIQSTIRKGISPGGGALTPGSRPLSQARAGDTLQGMAANLGKASNWQAIAEANNIENPRLLPPGQLIDLNAANPINR